MNTNYKNIMTEKDQKAIAIKSKLSAFSDFKDKGLPFIEKNYPDAVTFVIKNKDKSFPEIIEMLDNELAAL